jgi:hypothetical protein
MHIDLSESAVTLLKEISLDPNGLLFKVMTFTGTSFNTNGKDLNTDHTPRSTADLDDALAQLWKSNLVSRSASAESYTVTKLGYDYADELNK